MLYLFILVIFRLTLLLSSADSCRDVNIPGLNSEVYALEGDINIGALYSVTDFPVGQDMCTKKLRPESWVIEFVEATMFAVKLVNENQDILPNISLGIYIVDYCRTPNTALAKSLSFLPAEETCNENTNSRISTVNETRIDHYDVVGVIGTFSSSATVLVSYLYAVAQLPLVSFTATSDELSNKDNHPYFLRVVPPDVHQVKAMLKFISDNGWSFISIGYEEGSYGEKALDNVKLFADKYGICLATTQKLNSRTNFDAVVTELLRYPRARVVILFTGATLATGVMMAATTQNILGHFIWIGSDGLSDKLIYRTELAPQLIGSFLFMYSSFQVFNFSKYFKQLHVNSTTNPWLRQYFEIQGKCSFKNGTCGFYKTPADFSDFKPSSSISLIIDSVLTYADAIHRLLQNRCPNALGKEAQQCIKGDVLLKYLFNSSFPGVTGRMKFDEQGNLIGTYQIRQVKLQSSNQSSANNKSTVPNLIESPIAIYDISLGNITYTNNSISWGHLVYEYAENSVRPGLYSDDQPPTSVCSHPCTAREYSVPKEIICCWECRRCHSNEIVVSNRTSCDTCDTFTWPDEGSNYTTCVPIPLTFSAPSDTLSLIQICLAVGAILTQCLVVAAYFIYRENRVIKAASRELSILQMAGIFLGYVTVIVFQTRPTPDTCSALYFMFCMSFAWLYSPLIVKTVRIFRIFESSAKYNRRPSFVSPQSQIVFASVLIFLQVRQVEILLM